MSTVDFVRRVIIIGGGPAGMFAAISAAKESGLPPRSILILDANIKLGRKLGVTGDGRCNITNAKMSSEFFHGKNPKFVNSVLGRFSNEDLLGYFNGLGVEFREEEKGRFIPVTDQASTITDNIIEELVRYGVEVRLNTRIASIRKEDGVFIAKANDGLEFRSHKVVVATGGLTYPQLGSFPDGYTIAKTFGHEVVDPVPCLVGFETHEKGLFDLQGVQAKARAWIELRDANSKTISSSPEVTDEVMFTHYGVSGPAVFSLSIFAVRQLKTNSAVLILDFFPGLSVEEVDKKILSIWETNPSRTLGNSLIGILPKKHVQVIMRNVLQLDIDIPVANVSKAVRQGIVKALTHLEIRLKASRSFKEAQVTDGGIDTEKVDPRTMESKLCPGLFFAGEVLDIHGDCGGYNLQFAFSSGRAAGLAAIQGDREKQ